MSSYRWHELDTDAYEMAGLGRFYLGQANHIKILHGLELEQYVAAFVKENLKK